MAVITRRRTPRAAANTVTGILRVLDDVDVEQVADQAITVLADTYVPRGERMILWVPTEGGGEVPLRVRAVQRQALITSARPRQRVRLAVDAIATPDCDRPAAGRPASAAPAARSIGGIVREVPIRLLEIGAGGCSIESPVKFSEGVVGWLSVNGRNAQLHEVVRVCRSDWRSEQRWPWMCGVEFLTFEPPSTDSLRRHVDLFTTPRGEAQ